MEIITFECLGLNLQEPMGLILNWLISILCFIFFVNSKNNIQGDYSWWWKYFFLFFGISTFFGGLGHFFFQYTGKYGKIIPWFFGLISNLFIARAMLDFKSSNKLKNILISIIFFKFIIFTILTFVFMNFIFVTIDSTISIIVYILVIGLIQFFKSKKKHWFIATIGSFFLVIAGLFNALKIDFHIWFNRQDIAHVLMIFSLIFFYLSSKIKFIKYNIPNKHNF